MTILAQCYATAGYGTSEYNSETHECTHDCYASVDKILINKNYWKKKYGTSMSKKLNKDFGLGYNFKTFKITVFEDGTYSTTEEKRSDIFKK